MNLAVLGVAVIATLSMVSCRPKYLTAKDPQYSGGARGITILHTCGEGNVHGYGDCVGRVTGLAAETASLLRTRGVVVSLPDHDLTAVPRNLEDAAGGNDAVLLISRFGSNQYSAELLFIPMGSGSSTTFDVSLFGAPDFSRVWRFQVQVFSSPSGPARDVVGALDQDGLIPSAGGR